MILHLHWLMQDWQEFIMVKHSNEYESYFTKNYLDSVLILC